MRTDPRHAARAPGATTPYSACKAACKCHRRGGSWRAGVSTTLRLPILCTQHRPDLQNKTLSQACCSIQGLQPGGRGSVLGPTTGIVTSALCCSAGGGIWLHLQLLAPGSCEPCRLGCKAGGAATPNGGSRKEKADKVWFNTTSACTSGLAARPGTGLVGTKGFVSRLQQLCMGRETRENGESLVLHVQGGGKQGQPGAGGGCVQLAGCWVGGLRAGPTAPGSCSVLTAAPCRGFAPPASRHDT